MLTNAGCWRKKELHRKLNLGITGKTIAYPWLPHKMTPEKRVQKFPDLGNASDWSYRVGNLLQPIRSGKWRVISMEFLRSFLRRYFAGKAMVASPISQARKTVSRHVLITVFKAVMPPLNGLKVWKWRFDIVYKNLSSFGLSGSDKTNLRGSRLQEILSPEIIILRNFSWRIKPSKLYMGILTTVD